MVTTRKIAARESGAVTACGTIPMVLFTRSYLRVLSMDNRREHVTSRAAAGDLNTSRCGTDRSPDRIPSYPIGKQNDPQHHFSHLPEMRLTARQNQHAARPMDGTKLILVRLMFSGLRSA
jgi:hypothetical protein